jgi:FtsH-binding integral membrane protein
VSTSIQPPQRTLPPPQVLTALGLMALLFAVGLLRAALIQNWTQPVFAALGLFLLSATCGFWLYGLYRRLNWLRWVTVLAGAGGCLLVSRAATELRDPVQLGLYYLQVALMAPSVVLFVLPPARRWYTGDLSA